jgi:hypothetical protein
MSFEDVEATGRLRGPRDNRHVLIGAGRFIHESKQCHFSKYAGSEQFRVCSAHALGRGRNRIDSWCTTIVTDQVTHDTPPIPLPMEAASHCYFLALS